MVRHIQLKASHHGSSTHRVSINASFGDKPSGVVVWMYFDPVTLELGPFLWFGGKAGKPLPSLDACEVATHTKRNAVGVKTERPNIRVLPKSAFTRVHTMPALVDELFGRAVAQGPGTENIYASDDAVDPIGAIYPTAQP